MASIRQWIARAIQLSGETLRRTFAEPYDNIFRYLVPSARDPAEKYLVELDAYNGNGRCCCAHFTMRCEPLLSRSISPILAVQAGMIKLKVNRHVEDALRCEHILTARAQFCDEIIAAISHANDSPNKRLPAA